MQVNDLLDFIDKRIDQKTTYLRHYIGKVVLIKHPDFPTQKGWVKVTIPTLGWITEDLGAWCFPRFLNSLYIPAIGDYLDIGFLEGNRDRPVYYGKATEMYQLPSKYDGKINKQIIYESPKTKEGIVHNEDTNIYEIAGANESFVKGDTLKPELQKDITALTNLQTTMSAWTPLAGDGGLTLKTALTASGFFALPMGSLTNMNSIKIKGE